MTTELYRSQRNTLSCRIASHCLRNILNLDQDLLQKRRKAMKITWIGHSCFKVEEAGYRIVFDPYDDGYVPGLGPVRETAEEVLCSHEHGDHNARKRVTLVSGSKSPFTVTKIETFHDPLKGDRRVPGCRPCPQDWPRPRDPDALPRRRQQWQRLRIRRNRNRP